MTHRLLPILAILSHVLPRMVQGECTTPAFTTSDPNGGWSHAGYYVHNNMWNVSGYQVSETLHACAHDDWYVVARMDNSKGDGAVKTYPNVHKDYSNVPVASFQHLWSSFAASAPKVGIYNVSYDLWLNGVATAGSNEIMIWTENHKQVPGGKKAESVTLGGRAFDVWKSTNSSYIAFVPTAVMPSGRIDLLEIIHWVQSKGWIAANATVGQICYGIELVSTDGAEAKFAITDFSLNTTPFVASIRKGGPAARAAHSRTRPRYSLAGRRLPPQGEALARFLSLDRANTGK